MDISQLHQLFLQATGVSTDTRSIKQDNIFFALKGENFNGNTYAKKALKSGACYAVVDEETYNTSERTILVKDVLQALQDLARYHRNHLGIPILCLTGSNGKTTTKELITAVLSQKYRVTATQGNLNNHIGVPLTLLSMNENTQMGVVEMGANHIGEIKILTDIAQPDYGYITNFGKAHLEGFGSIAGVIQGKTELYDYLRRTDGMVFINADDPIQLEKSSNIKMHSFGTNKTADLHITYPSSGNFASIQLKESRIESKLTGKYNATNIAAAVTMGLFCGIDKDLVIQAIEQYIPSNNRSQIIEREGCKIILDAYNANPTSMEAALRNLASLSSEKKIAILGDMLELGKESLQEHKNIVELAKALHIDKLILVGTNFLEAVPQEKDVYEDYEQLKNNLPKEIYTNLQGEVLLIKGSRGMKLERFLDLLK